MRIKTKQTGDWAESVAARFLKKTGFKILKRNFNSRFGEIDIIALDCRDSEESIVFVEVRYRKKGSCIPPEETITARKQKRIKNTALIYMKRFGLMEAAVRFDVICISKEKWFDLSRINHIRDAF